MARSGTAASKPARMQSDSNRSHGIGPLSRDQKLELYYYMRLTRSLEERLVNLYRQTKVIGGLFRSLGQEADAVGSAYALDRSKGDVLSPLIRNLGSMLVQGAKPTEIIKGQEGQDGPVELRYRAHVAFTTAEQLMQNLEKLHNRRKAVIWVSSGYDFNPFEKSRTFSPLVEHQSAR